MFVAYCKTFSQPRRFQRWKINKHHILITSHDLQCVFFIRNCDLNDETNILNCICGRQTIGWQSSSSVRMLFLKLMILHSKYMPYSMVDLFPKKYALISCFDVSSRGKAKNGSVQSLVFKFVCTVNFVSSPNFSSCFIASSNFLSNIFCTYESNKSSCSPTCVCVWYIKGEK